ncbi:hypothetical protein [Nocardia sp. NPDC048505]|uniref:hypothetical protein n=1 Tax=unclassified Nocardia TaxID=2637762 RepID=UPI0033EDF45A
MKSKTIKATAAAFASVLILGGAATVTARPAQAATEWSAKTAGAKAWGTYWFSGGRSYVEGTLCDTASDERSAALSLWWNHNWNGPSRTEHPEAHGNGKCVDFSYNSQWEDNLKANIHTENYWGQYNGDDFWIWT